MSLWLSGEAQALLVLGGSRVQFLAGTFGPRLYDSSAGKDLAVSKTQEHSD